MDMILKYHFYADDGQLMKAANLRSLSHLNSSLEYLEHALHLVSQWMFLNKLKLNEHKTEFSVIGSKHSLSKVSIDSLTVGSESVLKSSTARNLGVLIDEHLSLIPQIYSVVKSCRYHLRSMWKIRRFLSADTAKALAHSMILSRVGYCNSLYLNMPAYAIELLQKVQNEAARFVTRTPRRESITPALVALHWLPVKQRISFKVLTIVYNALHDSGPQYIQDMIQNYESTHHLRSTSQIRLKENSFRLKSAGHRAFSIAAPHLWNSIPSNIKSCETVYLFKKSLKTYLFRQAYFSYERHIAHIFLVCLMYANTEQYYYCACFFLM